MKNRIYLGLLIILGSSCNILEIRTTELIVLGANGCEVTAYNGDRLLFSDTMHTSLITDFSKSYCLNYRFKDKLTVVIKKRRSTLKKIVKIRKSKYIYIVNRGLDFNVFGTNKEVPLL